MRGRDVYKRFRLLLIVLKKIYAIAPKKIALLTWSLFSKYETKLALSMRYLAASRLSRDIGEIVYFGPDVTIKNWHCLSLGSNVSIHKGTYIDAIGGVSIGNDVSIAHGVSIVSFDHTWANESFPIRDNPVRCSPIVIGDDVWVATGVRILCGSNVGSRVVLAANSVVRESIPGNVLVGGVPGRIIKRI